MTMLGETTWPDAIHNISKVISATIVICGVFWLIVNRDRNRRL
jgi:hypothetical protein